MKYLKLSLQMQAAHLTLGIAAGRMDQVARG